MIIHIGYPKTGTTFLQNNVFPGLEGIDYFDHRSCGTLFKPVYSNTSLEFKASVSKNSFSGTETTLYSFERMVGEMGTGVLNVEIADRLFSLGFRKVIVTIRRQETMADSIYRQYVQQGGVMKVSEFLADEDYFRLSFLDYYSLLSKYRELFGKENILVICQEELKENQEGVLSRLQEFCGSHSIQMEEKPLTGNHSLSKNSIRFLRLVNHFTHNHYRRSSIISSKFTTWRVRSFLQHRIEPLLKRHGKRKEDSFLSESAKKGIKQSCSDSNQKLMDEYELPLDRYGYV